MQYFFLKKWCKSNVFYKTKQQQQKKTTKKNPSLGGLEPPTFRLTVERANRLRHRDRRPQSNFI